MALIKGSQTTLDEWAVTANAAVRLGTELDVSLAYSCTLHIKAALGEAVASTGQPEVIIQITGEASPAKDDWTNYMRLVGPSGTPKVPTLNATEPAGETSLATLNPATAGIDNDGKFKFLRHATIANSEVVFQTANSGDGGDTITILDGLANEQNTNTIVVDFDDARVEAVSQWTITIDCIALSRIRIIYNADYDTDGPDVVCHSAYTLNTGI
ncbi:MAG: hypothetical protein JRD05_00710 [Deltaproteobacteria bacterium]|nr:hypothetical protein [Deltaproteobacteria bacterium]